jgi:hypothetical protein
MARRKRASSRRPDQTILDDVEFRTRRPRQAALHAEIVRLHDERGLSWAQIAKALKVTHDVTLTRSAVAKAYRRAKNPPPPPRGVPRHIYVIDWAARTVHMK